MRSVHLTARSRLTLLHTALALTTGTLLSVFTYLLMRRNLTERKVVLRYGGPGITGPLPPPDTSELARQVRDDALAALVRQGWIALAAVTLLATLLGWLVAGRVLRPIRTISATARRLSAENLSDRMPVGPARDELAALAGTVNGMLDRIQRGIAERDRALESQRLFTASAAHELRTPLATMRTAIDVTLDGEPSRAELLAMAEDVRTAADRNRRTLDGLLALAHSQAGTGESCTVDLATVTAGALAGAAAGLSARGLTAHRALRPAPMRGDPVLLERMTANLIDNALRYNRPAGRISVATGRTADGGFLRVVNTGRIVPAEQVEGLLHPFVRGPSSPSNPSAPDGGAGLGLSIVRAVAFAHQGGVTATANPDGGLDITVRFPAEGDTAGMVVPRTVAGACESGSCRPRDTATGS
ncbi:signal transduction histidine kinase [Streptomyces sp. 3330]|uniref:sensor histidine kinase n=1 Tax=Streptomyces sp. 3330 TaxID=2817755 RepID=UPI002856DC5C|nr:HAMP domain-containing sensor histidine kinase [Streptomyces sp. 3330]MDR6980783.1 signal transduction histidine kinase [Streptomyces sp. 3330]